LQHKFIGYKESTLQGLINTTLLINRQSKLVRRIGLASLTQYSQPKREKKDWRDPLQIYSSRRLCTFCKKEGHIQDFCYLRKGTKTNPVRHDVKMNQLNFPSAEVTQQENQEEEYDSQKSTDDYCMSSIIQEERDTNTDLSIYGIREIP
jgi:hypothetical protein